MYEDQICLGDISHCVDSFTFIAVSESNGLDFTDGIVGLSPNVYGNGPSFIEYLKRDRVIDEMIIGVYIASLGK